jgi:hypothetical protein
VSEVDGAGRVRSHDHAGTSGAGVTGTVDERQRPRVVRGDDDAYRLIEGPRRRAVTSDAAHTLIRTLGPVTAHRDDHVRGRDVPDGSGAIALVAEPGVSGLADCAAAGAAVAVAGTSPIAVSAGRTVTPFSVGHPGREGAKLLDRLTVARLRGTTHLVLPADDGELLTRNPELADHLARRATIVATNETGTIWKLPPAPAPGPPKVFGIGLNKTGTTSLHLACKQLGLRSFHWGSRPAYLGITQAERDGERLLHRIGEQYDVYSDIETLSLRFDIADLQYPGSRFILTVRDVDGWVDSRRRHVERNRRNKLAGRYDGVYTRIDEDLWRRQWQRHLDQVRDWFRGRDDDLLVLDIEGGDGWERLAPFLGRPAPNVPFPRGNVYRDGGRFETLLTASWRAVRRYLPPRLADAIGGPSKRVLRALSAGRDRASH